MERTQLYIIKSTIFYLFYLISLFTEPSTRRNIYWHTNHKFWFLKINFIKLIKFIFYFQLIYHF